MKTTTPKVAIVCDWLTGIGGAERVVLELHHMYPEAPIFTSQYDNKALPWFNDADVRTTWLQKLPKSLKKFLPVLRAWTFSRLDLSDYGLVISSSGAEAKSIKTGPNTTHICYCHAPTHYYWSRYDEYIKNPGFGWLDPLARFGLKILVNPMRKWDKKAAQRPNFLLANSTYTQDAIKKYYNRDSTVLYPPVEINRFSVSKNERKGFVIAGRQTPYKRIDLAVAACTQLNLPLTVIGNGPEHDNIVSLAGPTINFITNVSDKDMAKYFGQAKAFIFPGIDDFGIVAVEALAAGTPVIAYKDGGALDYIANGKNGIFFDHQTVESLVDALKQAANKSFDHVAISKSAVKFSVDNFRANAKHFVTKIDT